MKYFLIFSLMASCGCTTLYYKDDAKPGEFERASTECEYKAYGVPMFREKEFYKRCMAGYGWHPEE